MPQPNNYSALKPTLYRGMMIWCHSKCFWYCILKVLCCHVLALVKVDAHFRHSYFPAQQTAECTLKTNHLQQDIWFWSILG